MKFSIWMPTGPELDRVFLEAFEGARHQKPDRLVLINTAHRALPERPARLADQVIEFPDKTFNFARYVNMALAGSAGRDEALVIWTDVTRPRPDLLEKMLGHLDRGASCVGVLQIDPDHQTINHAGITYDAAGWPRHMGWKQPVNRFPLATKCRKVVAVNAAIMALNVRDALGAGGWDEEYEVGHEDMDFCLTLSDSGKRVLYCGETYVHHREARYRYKYAAKAAFQKQGARFREKWPKERIMEVIRKVGDGHALDGGLK